MPPTLYGPLSTRGHCCTHRIHHVAVVKSEEHLSSVFCCSRAKFSRIPKQTQEPQASTSELPLRGDPCLRLGSSWNATAHMLHNPWQPHLCNLTGPLVVSKNEHWKVLACSTCTLPIKPLFERVGPRNDSIPKTMRWQPNDVINPVPRLSLSLSACRVLAASWHGGCSGRGRSRVDPSSMADTRLPTKGRSCCALLMM